MQRLGLDFWLGIVKTRRSVGIFLLLVIISSLLASPASSQRTYLEVEKDITPNQISLSSLSNLSNNQIRIDLRVSVPKEIKMNVVFAIDSSESMKESDPNNLRVVSVKNFISKMQPSTGAVGLVSWDHDVDFSVPLTSNFSKVISRLRDINSEGGTNLNVGLRAAIDLLSANNREGIKVIVFLTDGVGDYIPPSNPSSPLREAIENGYIIYTIGLGDKVDDSVLKEIADVTGGRYIHASDALSLLSVFEEIRTEVVDIKPPRDVRVIEVLPSYVTVVGNFTRTPESKLLKTDGFTRIEWDVGDMKIGESWEVRFNVSLNLSKVPIEAYKCEGSRVIYEDYVGKIHEKQLPQLTVSIKTPENWVTGMDSFGGKILSNPLVAAFAGGLTAISFLAYHLLRRGRA